MSSSPIAEMNCKTQEHRSSVEKIDSNIELDKKSLNMDIKKAYDGLENIIIVPICGRKGAGKNTTAGILTRIIGLDYRYASASLAFADLLKIIMWVIDPSMDLYTLDVEECSLGYLINSMLKPTLTVLGKNDAKRGRRRDTLNNDDNKSHVSDDNNAVTLDQLNMSVDNALSILDSCITKVFPQKLSQAKLRFLLYLMANVSPIDSGMTYSDFKEIHGDFVKERANLHSKIIQYDNAVQLALDGKGSMPMNPQSRKAQPLFQGGPSPRDYMIGFGKLVNYNFEGDITNLTDEKVMADEKNVHKLTKMQIDFLQRIRGGYKTIFIRSVVRQIIALQAADPGLKVVFITDLRFACELADLMETPAALCLIRMICHSLTNLSSDLSETEHLNFHTTAKVRTLTTDTLDQFANTIRGGNAVLLDIVNQYKPGDNADDSRQALYKQLDPIVRTIVQMIVA